VRSVLKVSRFLVVFNEMSYPLACQIGYTMDEGAERNRLLTYFSNSYSAYFKSDDLSLELSKLEEYVEESVAKLDELESLFHMNAGEFQEWDAKIIPTIVEQNKAMLELFSKRLEFLNRLVQSLKGTLDTLEAQIGQAEQAFGLNSPFRNVLSYFRKPVEPAMMVHTLESAKFVPIPDLDIDSKFIPSQS